MKKQHSHYRFQSKRYDRGIGTLPADRIRFEITLALAGSGNRILDVGCGSGLLAEKLKKAGNEVYGLDISPKAVKKAQKSGVRVSVCNLETKPWPVKKSYFDVVVAGEIIEHILDVNLFLKKIHQTLKPKGRLVLSTPNVASLGRRLMLALGKNPYLEPSYHPERAGHVRYYTKDSLLNLLKENHFNVKKLCTNVVLFSYSGKIFSTKLAKIFPTLGKNLIVEAVKK